MAVPFRVPLNRRFRQVEHREGMLFCGPSGWGEWAPFPEYDDWEAARWLAAAVEAAWGTWPEPVRSHVPVNVVVPALPPEDIAGYVTDAVAQTGRHHVQGQGRPSRGRPWPTTWPASPPCAPRCPRPGSATR